MQAIVPAAREHEWREWMLGDHIPKLKALPYFVDAQLLKEERPGESVVTFRVVYEVQSRELLEEYFASAACAQLRSEGAKRFSDVVLTREIWQTV